MKKNYTLTVPITVEAKGFSDDLGEDELDEAVEETIDEVLNGNVDLVLLDALSNYRQADSEVTIVPGGIVLKGTP